MKQFIKWQVCPVCPLYWRMICSVSVLFTINVETIVVIIINNNDIGLFNVEKYKWSYNYCR